MKKTVAEPIWSQVKNNISDTIEKGIWRPGSMIPNEATLVDNFKVSIGTLRKAVSELEQQGILIRKQGIGTFVASHNEDSFLYKYFHILPKGANEKTFPETHLIHFKKRAVKTKEAAILQIAKSSKVFDILNTLSIDGQTCIADRIVISADKFAMLNANVFEKRIGTIYKLYQDAFGIFITRISERICAEHPNHEISALIDVKPQDPVLKITRISYTFNDKPVELRSSYVHTESVEYYAEDYANNPSIKISHLP